MHKVDLPGWAVERGRVLNAFDTLAPGRTALINVDMQNAFVAEGQVYGNPHARDIVDGVNRLSRAMRSIGAPVIWTRQTHARTGPNAPPAWRYDLSHPKVLAAVEALAAGADGHEIHAAMDVAPTDTIVDKFRYGALSCPAGDLARALATNGVEMIIITGTLTNVCCETTAREAYMAGYKVIVVSDATAAVTDAEHNAALLNLRLNFADVLSVEEVLTRIAAAGRARGGPTARV
jgi:nicotinamidase-related amidase